MTTPPDRAAFLSRIRDALGPRAAPVPPPPPLDDAAVRTVPAAADLPARFAAATTAVGMSVHRAPAADLGPRLAGLLRTLGVRRVTTALTPGDLPPIVEASLRAAACEILPRHPAPTFEPHYDADASVTDVVAAIAETGSLLITSGPDHPRAAFLVPPVHIAIVRATQLLPDLADFFPTLTPTTLPASLVLVTGPSKTADIEGILITGVHGPRQVHILLLDP